MRREVTAGFLLLFLVAFGLMFHSPAPVGAQAAPVPSAAGVIEAYTEPSKRRELRFNGVGLIREVLVKEGDPVKSGQILMIQDDEIEALELQRLKNEAENQARVEYAVADLEVKKKIFERKSTAPADVYNRAEIEEAELAVVAGDKQLDIAKLDHEQNKIKANQQEAKLVRMKLPSNIDGVVVKIEVWEGELAEPSKAAIIVAQNNPMHVMIKDLYTHQVSRLSVGEELEVKYPDEKTWRKAKIQFISPVADAGSNTQLVRLEMPNSDNRATGLPIQVKLPPRLLEGQSADKTAANR